MNKSANILISFIIGLIVGALMGARSCSTHTTTTQIDTLITQHYDTTFITKTRVIYRIINGDTVRNVQAIAPDTACKPFIAFGDTVTMADRARISPSFSYPEMTFSTYYRPAPDTSYRITQTTNSVLQGWSFGVGVGYGMSEVDGIARVKPWVGVSLQKTLIGW